MSTNHLSRLHSIYGWYLLCTVFRAFRIPYDTQKRTIHDSIHQSSRMWLQQESISFCHLCTHKTTLHSINEPESVGKSLVPLVWSWMRSRSLFLSYSTPADDKMKRWFERRFHLRVAVVSVYMIHLYRLVWCLLTPTFSSKPTRCQRWD